MCGRCMPHASPICGCLGGRGRASFQRQQIQNIRTKLIALSTFVLATSTSSHGPVKYGDICTRTGHLVKAAVGWINCLPAALHMALLDQTSHLLSRARVQVQACTMELISVCLRGWLLRPRGKQ